jgi:hypothetical protein
MFTFWIRESRLGLSTDDAVRSGSGREEFFGIIQRCYLSWISVRMLEYQPKMFLIDQKEKITGVFSTGVTFWIRERILLGYQPKMLPSINHREKEDVYLMEQRENTA